VDFEDRNDENFDDDDDDDDDRDDDTLFPLIDDDGDN
jgi:hypothetical protein